jgi:2-polyprenyl-3-methyl-5-hydroxy-6-metoxy-1,4-benzoquinol methylase
MDSKNYINYREDHWSEVKDDQKALEKYLTQYEDIYNVNNVDRFLQVLDDHGLKSCRILDYGGGCGMLSCRLAASGHDVTLGDQSQIALDAAHLLAKSFGVTIQTLRVDTADDFDSESYDVIVMKDLVEHVVEDNDLVKALSRALRKNGLMIFSSQNRNSLNYIVEAGARKLIYPKRKWMGWDRTHLRFYTPKSMKKLISDSELTYCKFSSAYIIPYKFIMLIPLPYFIKKRVYRIGFTIDRIVCGLFGFSKAGWNLMIVAKK